MSPAVLIVAAIAAGAVVGFLARKMSLSWVIAGGGGFIAAAVAFIVLAPSPPSSDSRPEAQSTAPPVVTQSTAPASPPPLPPADLQAPQQQTSQVNTELQHRCVQQAKSQGYRSGQCAYAFIDTCIKTQSRKEMEDVLRFHSLTGMGQALSCSNMPSTYVADFDKF